MVSGLGISSASEKSMADADPEAVQDLGFGGRVLSAPDPVEGGPAVAEDPVETQAWCWATGSGTAPPYPARKAISPEMRDKCFRYLEKGHFRRDYMNDVVCIWCSLPGYESKDCKHPRSPSPEEELRREAAAKVTRRVTLARGWDGSASGSAAEPHWASSAARQAPPPPRLVHAYRPEDFLVVFARQEDRNRLGQSPTLRHLGVRAFFRQWNRQSHAVHAVMRYKVLVEMEGIPPRAWDRGVAEDLLGSSCIIDSVAPKTSSRLNLSSFKLSAWTTDPQTILARRWLAVLEPATHMFESQMLQYKILIHMDSVTDFADADEPFFLGGYSNSGQSGLPEEEKEMERGGGATTRRRRWQFGVMDTPAVTLLRVTAAVVLAAGSTPAAKVARQRPKTGGSRQW